MSHTSLARLKSKTAVAAKEKTSLVHRYSKYCPSVTAETHCSLRQGEKQNITFAVGYETSSKAFREAQHCVAKE